MKVFDLTLAYLSNIIFWSTDKPLDIIFLYLLYRLENKIVIKCALGAIVSMWGVVRTKVHIPHVNKALPRASLDEYHWEVPRLQSIWKERNQNI